MVRKMTINSSSITPTESDSGWTVSPEFNNKFTFLEEDRKAYELTSEELRRPLYKEM